MSPDVPHVPRAGEGTARVEGGRLLPPAHALSEGSYRLTFDAASYFAAQDTRGFYHEVSVTFVVRDPSAHYHVPLLVSPWAYSTYRGS